MGDMDESLGLPLEEQQRLLAQLRIAPPNIQMGNGAPMPNFPRQSPLPQPPDEMTPRSMPTPNQQIPNFNQQIPNLPTETMQSAMNRPNVDLPTVNPNQQKLNDMIASKPGYQNIKNPILHGLAATGNVLASVFPGIGAAIPGTTAHHDEQIAEQEGLLNQDVKRGQEQATTAATQSEIPLRAAETRNQNAEADLRENPKPEKKDIHQLYADAVSEALEHGMKPSDSPKVQQLADSITSLQPERAVKPEQRDDRAIAINSKPPEQRTAEENAYLKGYDKWVQQTKVAPGVMRMEVMGNMRQYPVVDKNGQAVWNNANAINAATQAGTPAGAAQYSPQVQGNIAAGKEAVHGVPVIQTALHHLTQMDTATNALETGDVKALNAIANAYGVQVGSEPLATYRGIQQIIRGDILAASSAVGTKNENEEKAIDAITDPSNPPKAIRASIGAIRQLMTDRLKSKGEVFKQAQTGEDMFTPQIETAPKPNKPFNWNDHPVIK